VRVAYYSPLPPERSGIADYSALLLPALQRLVDVDVVRRGRTRPVAADVALYHIGNDPEAHAWIVDALRRRPGVVVLHEFVLHHLVAGLTIGRKDGPGYLAAMERDAGVPGRLLAHGVLDGRVPPPWETHPDEFPLAGEVLASATGLIVHSHYVEDYVRSAFDGPVWRIPHPAWSMPDVVPAQIDGRPLFGCFGHLNASKRVPQLLEAFAAVRQRHPHARLLLVGPASPRFDTKGLTGEGVERIDYVEEQRLWSLMAACDACISLRAPTMGETSGSVIRALSLGRPLVVSDVGWFAELPDGVALKVPVDDDEVPGLAAALELLASSEPTQLAMSDAAREYAGEHDVTHVAHAYVAALEEAAGGTIVADAVVADVARAAAEIGVEPGSEFAAELAGRLDEVGLARNGRPEPAPPLPRNLLAGIPPWAWLTALVIVSAVFRYGLSRRVVAPWIMVDELIYSELAKSFAETGHFLIRDVHHGAYGAVYPLLIAPAWRVFSSVPDAYAAAKAIGSVLMSLAAIPTYFLGRRVLSPLWALAAAVLAVAVPSMMYTGTLMTETVFYPIFVGVSLALVLALERPTVTRQLVVLAACLLAFLTRSQAIVLIPAVATAPLVLAWLDRRRVVRVVREFRALYGILVAAVAGALIVQLARGRSPLDLLGSYSVTGHADYRADQVLKWLLYHVSELDLYLGVLPFAAVLLLVALGRSLDRPLRVLLAATLPLAGWLLLEVAAFASALSPRIQERNLFYVAPLFFVALLAWIERGMPRPPRAAAIAVVVAAALPGALPYHKLIDTSAESDTLALLPLWWLQETIVGLNTVSVVVVAVAAVLGVVFLTISPRYALVLPAFVLLWFAFATERIERFDHGFPKASIGALYQGITASSRDWVDKTVGRDADVAFLYSGADPTQQPLTLWENEFYNRSIGPVYDLRQQSMGDLPETKVHQRADGVLLTPDGQPVRTRYVLSDNTVPLAGELIGRDDVRAMQLRRTDGRLAIASRVSGTYPDGWSKPRVTYTRLRCRGGRVTAVVASDANLFTRTQTVRAAGRSVTFAPGDVGRLTVPLHPQNGVCRVTFSVSPTAVPAVVNGGADGRRLGARFAEFEYRAP
jgi:glycosyltransferase involved in cell wall biosynthesis